ncbi:hypothetical protein JQ032_17660 [Clostridium botulinum]|nr:hypothetical protein [Clostridium botulinum]MCS4476758.1 hypothetical protein [Clostridium botulinum]
MISVEPYWNANETQKSIVKFGAFISVAPYWNVNCVLKRGKKE